MPFKKVIEAAAKAVKGVQPGGSRPRRGMSLIADLVASKIAKGNAIKKGGAVKNSSDAIGRAVKRKTADVKGRAMKKGK